MGSYFIQATMNEVGKPLTLLVITDRLTITSLLIVSLGIKQESERHDVDDKIQT